jgi:membrane protein DedA with SNARE-associated domain
MALQLDDFKPFIDWLQANPGLASITVFFISCAESLAIVGLFIPGTIVMPAIGGMIGAGILPAYWIVIAAILGAMLGDNLSYWLGHHYHEQIRNYWPFNRVPKILERGEIFFKKYGGISVFIGRFVGPVRPIIPVIAGMLNMSPARFTIANATSAIIWALVYIAPGILLGAVSEQLAPHVAARLLLMLALVTAIAWIALWISNKLWNSTQKIFEHFFKALWLKATIHIPTLHRMLLHKHINNHKPFSIIFYTIFLTLLLTFISLSVARHGTMTYLDWPVFLFLRSIEISPLDTVMASASHITNIITLCSIGIALFAWLFLQKEWRIAFYWLANIALTYCMIKILQYFIPMAPPDLHTQLKTFHTFPSISLGIFTALLGNFLIPSYYSLTWLRYKKPLLLLILFLISCATLPKLYFGFHWLSSCIASVLCAAISSWVFILFFHRRANKINLKPLLFIGSIAAIIATSTLSIKDNQAFILQLEKPQFKMSYNLQKWWNNEALPVFSYRKNILGAVTEPLSVQYAGHLSTLITALEKQGWGVAPKPSVAVILNRIGAKNRYDQLPLLPDLYLAKKPDLIMTKIDTATHKMLILRLWASGILLQPHNVPLWIGSIRFHTLWHWRHQTPALILENNLPLLLTLQMDLAKFSTQIIQPKVESCHVFCQIHTLKIFNDKKMKRKDINDEF